MSRVGIWEKSRAGRGNSKCKGLELRACFLCWRNIRTASAATQKEQREAGV